jgi:mono/diheme cytochrome c family protein
MSRHGRLFPLTLFVAALALWTLARAQTSGITLPQDKGPDKIDVSSYPPDMQKGYKLFVEKCAKCHTIARPLNTTMPVEDWRRYVKRMMHKPNSGIGDDDGKQIFEFLSYDQTNRKEKDPKSFFPALSDEELQKLAATQGE